jgi:hypothetical protein
MAGYYTATLWGGYASLALSGAGWILAVGLSGC